MERKQWILAACSAAALVVAGAFWWTQQGGSAAVEADAATAAAATTPAGALSEVQIAKLGITTARAEVASDVALGMVPALVTLPPEARVAVTAPFTGSVIRLYVVAGQAVTRGQPLAIVRSREPVQYGAELARARGPGNWRAKASSLMPAPTKHRRRCDRRKSMCPKMPASFPNPGPMPAAR